MLAIAAPRGGSRLPPRGPSVEVRDPSAYSTLLKGGKESQRARQGCECLCGREPRARVLLPLGCHEAGMSAAAGWPGGLAGMRPKMPFDVHPLGGSCPAYPSWLLAHLRLP